MPISGYERAEFETLNYRNVDLIQVITACHTICWMFILCLFLTDGGVFILTSPTQHFILWFLNSVGDESRQGKQKESIWVYFTSQSDPFCDFKEQFQEEAVDRGWTFTFTFHRSRVCAAAERRLLVSLWSQPPEQTMFTFFQHINPSCPPLPTHTSIRLFKC